VQWTAITLDKRSPIPLYYQLAEAIRERILLGDLRPGDQLPAEREIGDRAGISRMTARQAIAYLVRQGFLVVRPGLGTFVAEPKLSYDPLHLLSFTEEVVHQGGRAESRVLEQAIVIPPGRVAAGLALAPEAAAVKIVRLRFAAGIPLLLETSFVPADLCPGLEQEDLASQSLYTLLEQRYGLRLTRALQTLEATTANDYERRLFDIASGTPMILLEGVTYLDSERPAEYFKAIYRGDRVKFELESRRDVAPEVSGAPRISMVLV
jgi:GntR family transcriptional regulator